MGSADPRIPVSVFTITQNAADCCGLTIREMCKRFQEVNVVVGPSEDATEAIVAGLEAEFPGTLNWYMHKFETHAKQYKRALDMCTKDWCLQLASDEFLFPHGIPWDTIFEDEQYDGYKFNRFHSVYSLSHYDQKVYPDVGMRLARRGKAGVTQTEIHECFRLTEQHPTGKMRMLEQHVIDIGDIRCEEQLAIKGKVRHAWYAGDLYNREYFDAAGTSPAKTFLLRKEDGRKTAARLPKEYIDYLHEVVPVGSAIWKELPCRSESV